MISRWVLCDGVLATLFHPCCTMARSVVDFVAGFMPTGIQGALFQLSRLVRWGDLKTLYLDAFLGSPRNSPALCSMSTAMEWPLLLFSYSWHLLFPPRWFFLVAVPPDWLSLMSPISYCRMSSACVNVCKLRSLSLNFDPSLITLFFFFTFLSSLVGGGRGALGVAFWICLVNSVFFYTFSTIFVDWT